MREYLWRALAWLLARPAVSTWIIARAMRTPYRHLEGYMNRWWLFNPYPDRFVGEEQRSGYISWLPSIRVHHILRRDRAEHLHDHPWDARTIILKGNYCEYSHDPDATTVMLAQRWRKPGHTAPILFGKFHEIVYVSDGGVWTLFITWKYRGKWGFLVDGKKMPYDEYFRRYPEREA